MPVIHRGTTDETYEAIIADLAYRYEHVFSVETIRAAVQEAKATLESPARIPDFVPVLVERHAREQLRAAAQAEGKIVKTVPELLFVCVQNAGRSQMAAALTRHHAGGRVHVRSAGSAPSGQILSSVIEALAEQGITLDEAFPKPLTGDVVRAADVIVTMGCGDACPVLPGRRYEDWAVSDPDGLPLAQVREIRNDIERRVRVLLDDILEDS
ncbi:MAG: arsenate reductase ArsC [Actinomycetota bacterium]|jgi:protein-tyrosine-phosphatase|nr:arsenate reductase ArsC [Actinomycetota bacterium]MDQ3527085.1 arsenate reductase ArsC [Actinomycetota bacterium]